MKLLLLLQSIFFLFRFIESTDDNLVLNSILKRFKITTKTKLENLFPDLTSLKTEQINNLKTLNECYNMKVGDKNFSIFNDRISPVIIHYFVSIFLCIKPVFFHFITTNFFKHRKLIVD